MVHIQSLQLPNQTWLNFVNIEQILCLWQTVNPTLAAVCMVYVKAKHFPKDSNLVVRSANTTSNTSTISTTSTSSATSTSSYIFNVHNKHSLILDTHRDCYSITPPYPMKLRRTFRAEVSNVTGSQRRRFGYVWEEDKADERSQSCSLSII